MEGSYSPAKENAPVVQFQPQALVGVRGYRQRPYPGGSGLGVDHLVAFRIWLCAEMDVAGVACHGHASRMGKLRSQAIVRGAWADKLREICRASTNFWGNLDVFLGLDQGTCDGPGHVFMPQPIIILVDSSK